MGNGNSYLVKRIYIFDYVRIWARWIGPLRLAECFVGISWVNVDILRSVSWVFLWGALIFCGMFATCSFCVCYIFAKQKYGFWRVKTPFLACKSMVFTLQKYGFCFLNVMLLQIGSNIFRVWMWIFGETNMGVLRYACCVFVGVFSNIFCA